MLLTFQNHLFNSQIQLTQWDIIDTPILQAQARLGLIGANIKDLTLGVFMMLKMILCIIATIAVLIFQLKDGTKRIHYTKQK